MTLMNIITEFTQGRPPDEFMSQCNIGFRVRGPHMLAVCVARLLICQVAGWVGGV